MSFGIFSNGEQIGFDPRILKGPTEFDSRIFKGPTEFDPRIFKGPTEFDPRNLTHGTWPTDQPTNPRDLVDSYNLLSHLPN